MLHELNRKLDALSDQNDRIIGLLTQILGKEIAEMKTLTDLQNDVANETTVDNSIVTLVTGLSAQIAALKTTQTDPATAAAIDALATQVEANSASISAAVTANTPAPAAS